MKFLLFILISAMLVSCGASNSGDNNKITGTYRTIVFIQPAPADYPVDL